MKRSILMIVAATLVALPGVDPAMAQQKKTLAVVVKGLDNPFFTVLGDGCALWNKENPKSEYTCLYTGPASSADEAGEVQIVEDLINKGVAGIAISPSNAPAMAKMLKAKSPKMPIMTIDADLVAADRGLRRTYLGTNNYDMGVLMAKHLKELKPKGGSVCLQLGNVAADNINARAAGFRDTIGGKKGVDRHDRHLRILGLQHVRHRRRVGRRYRNACDTLVDQVLDDLHFARFVGARRGTRVKACVLGTCILLVPKGATVAEDGEERVVQSFHDDCERLLLRHRLAGSDQCNQRRGDEHDNRLLHFASFIDSL